MSLSRFIVSDWNPVSVEQEILDTVNAGAKGIAVARDAYAAFLEADRLYKKAYNKAYMLHKGPQTEKKIAAALVSEVEALEIARDAADVAYTHAKDYNAWIKGKLEAFRSVGASVREAYKNAGRGEW